MSNVDNEDELIKQLETLKLKLNLNYKLDKNDPVHYIIIAVHGIGCSDSSLESDYKTLKYTIESIRKYWFYQQRIKIHLHVINWKKYIIDAQNTLFDNVCIDTIKGVRRIVFTTFLDIVFYFNPRFSDFLVSNVASEINNEITRLRSHPSNIFKDSKIILIGYSLGSVIIDDLLRNDFNRMSNSNINERPKITHKIDYFFAVGSPIAASLIYHNPQYLTDGLKFPNGIQYFNVFHPYDPVACRFEKLIYKDKGNIPDPIIVPFWQNNGFKNWYDWDKRMKQAKSVIVDNITDVATSISKSIFGWWGHADNDSVLNRNITSNDNRMKAFESFRNSMSSTYLIYIWNLQMEAINLYGLNIQSCGLEHNDIAENEESTIRDGMTDDVLIPSNPLDELNKYQPKFPIRYDYQLQEDATEHYLNPIAVLQSHVSYWASKDVAFFILKTIHGEHEPIPITTLLTSIETKAKKLSLSTNNEKLRKEFSKVAGDATKELQHISTEESKIKIEGVTFRSAWNVMTKNIDVDLYTDGFSTLDFVDEEM